MDLILNAIQIIFSGLDLILNAIQIIFSGLDLILNAIQIIFSGLDLILNAISKEVLEKQPREEELKKIIALYLKRELKMRETNGFSVLEAKSESASAKV